MLDEILSVSYHGIYEEYYEIMEGYYGGGGEAGCYKDVFRESFEGFLLGLEISEDCGLQDVMQGPSVPVLSFISCLNQEFAR